MSSKLHERQARGSALTSSSVASASKGITTVLLAPDMETLKLPDTSNGLLSALSVRLKIVGGLKRKQQDDPHNMSTMFYIPTNVYVCELDSDPVTFKDRAGLTSESL